jgi:hypothetical protein
VNQGLIGIVQDGTSFDTRFSYEVSNPYGLTSEAVNADIIFNTSPLWIARSITFTALNQAQTLTPSQINVADSSPASQLQLVIQEASGCTLTAGSTTLAVGDSFFQSDVDNGKIQFSAQSETTVLKLNAVDQYNAQTSATINMDYKPDLAANSSHQPKNTLPTILGTSISGASFVVGVAYKAYTIYKERQKSIRICPLGRLLRDELGLSGLSDFDSKDGIQFVQSINAIDAQLAGQGVTYTALPHDRQQLLAEKLAEYFESAQGSHYILTTRSLDSLKQNHYVCTAYLTKCGDAISSPKILDHAEVKANASTIASKVAEMYRGALSKKSTQAFEMSAL